MLKASNLRDMSVDDLQVALSDLAKEVYNLVNEMKRANKPAKPHMLRQKRKDKARLLTILHEKQSFNS